MASRPSGGGNRRNETPSTRKRRPDIGYTTVRSFEAGSSATRAAIRDTIRRTIEAHGVAFTNGDAPGIRLPGSDGS